jgi:hypothetical protein
MNKTAMNKTALSSCEWTRTFDEAISVLTKYDAEHANDTIELPVEAVIYMTGLANDLEAQQTHQSTSPP